MVKLTKICSGHYVSREFGFDIKGHRGSWMLSLPDSSRMMFTGRDPFKRNIPSVCRTVTGIRSLKQIEKGDISKCMRRCSEQMLLSFDDRTPSKIAVIEDLGMMEIPIADSLPFYSIRSISKSCVKNKVKKEDIL